MEEMIYDLSTFIESLEKQLKFNKIIENIRVDSIFKGKLNEDIKYKLDYSYDSLLEYIEKFKWFSSCSEDQTLKHFKNISAIYNDDDLGEIQKPKMIASYFNMIDNIRGLSDYNIDDIKVYTFVHSYLNKGIAHKAIKILNDKEIHNLVMNNDYNFLEKVERCFLTINNINKQHLYNYLDNKKRVISKTNLTMAKYNENSASNEKDEFFWYLKNQDDSIYFNELKLKCLECSKVWHFPRDTFFTEEEVYELQVKFKSYYNYVLENFTKKELDVLKDELEAFYIRHFEEENKKKFDFLELDYPNKCPNCKQKEYKELGFNGQMIELLLEEQLTKSK